MFTLKNAKSKLSNARKVTGLPKDLYLLTDYMSVNCDDVVTTLGLFLLLMFSLRDISAGESGFKTDEFSSLLKVRKKEVLESKIYIVKVIDEIASPEFAGEFREILEKNQKWILPPKTSK